MDKYMKKSRYCVEYYGWKPVMGIKGRTFTEPVIQELLRRHKNGGVPNVTLQLSKKALKVSREMVEAGKSGRPGKIKCIKYPPVPTKDIVFAIQGLDPHTDIVACIFLGFNPKTRRYVHSHVYRFDSKDTAAIFVSFIQIMSSIPENVERTKQVERDLLSKNQIHQAVVYKGNVCDGEVDIKSRNESSKIESPSAGVEEDLISLLEVTPIDNVTDELRHRLMVGGTPLLLPPIDYDTVSRNRGNPEKAHKRKCLNPEFVGQLALFSSSDSNIKPSANILPESSKHKNGDELSATRNNLNMPHSNNSGELLENGSAVVETSLLSPNAISVSKSTSDLGSYGSNTASLDEKLKGDVKCKLDQIFRSNSQRSNESKFIAGRQRINDRKDVETRGVSGSPRFKEPIVNAHLNQNGSECYQTNIFSHEFYRNPHQLNWT